MSIASRYGKLRVAAEDDGTRFRRLEDLLTADVFGAFRYLPPHLGACALLERAVSPDGVSLRAWAEAAGLQWAGTTLASFAFWPRLAGKEPDLVILLGDHEDPGQLLVLVEVKLHAEQHEIGGISQIGFYGAAMLDELFDEPPFEISLPTLRPVVLLTGESEPPASALLRARCELGDRHAQGVTDAFWLSWATVAIVTNALLEQQRAVGRPPHELAVLEDLAADLAERGFTPPRPRTSFPLPQLEPLPAPWHPWTAAPSAKAWRPCPQGLHLDRIDAALATWRLR